MVDHNVFVHDNVTVSDSVSVTKGLYFELAKPVHCTHKQTDSNKIQLDFDNESYLLGFRINGIANKDDEINALKTAFKLINYLTLKTGHFLHFKKIVELVNGKPQLRQVESKKIILSESLDFTNSAFVRLISDDSKKSQSVAHLASGIKAVEMYSYDQAIREFFLVIENSRSQDERKYKALRHAVSHEQLDDPNVLNDVNQFGLRMKERRLDVTDPQNHEILKKEAHNLRTIATSYVLSLLK